MFTKAYIVSIPEPGDNVFKIRIPLFEDTTGTEIIYDALCCHAPGVYGGYNKGDCVYVSFEDAKINIPVIVGRLYVSEKDDYAKGYFNNLDIPNSAKLPLNTTFGDEFNASNLKDLLQKQNTTEVDNIFPVGAYFITARDTNRTPELMWPGTEWTGTDGTVGGQNITMWRRTK